MLRTTKKKSTRKNLAPPKKEILRMLRTFIITKKKKIITWFYYGTHYFRVYRLFPQYVFLRSAKLQMFRTLIYFFLFYRICISIKHALNTFFPVNFPKNVDWRHHPRSLFQDFIFAEKWRHDSGLRQMSTKDFPPNKNSNQKKLTNQKTVAMKPLSYCRTVRSCISWWTRHIRVNLFETGRSSNLLLQGTNSYSRARTIRRRPTVFACPCSKHVSKNYPPLQALYSRTEVHYPLSTIPPASGLAVCSPLTR